MPRFFFRDLLRQFTYYLLFRTEFSLNNTGFVEFVGYKLKKICSWWRSFDFFAIYLKSWLFFFKYLLLTNFWASSPNSVSWRYTLGSLKALLRLSNIQIFINELHVLVNKVGRVRPFFCQISVLHSLCKVFYWAPIFIVGSSAGMWSRELSAQHSFRNKPWL